MTVVAQSIDVLRGRLGPDVVLTDKASLGACRHDYWVLSHLRRRIGQLCEPPACVVRPETTSDVATVLSVANEHRTPVVTFGAGSGVCGGVLAPPDSIVLDISRLDRMVDLNQTSLTTTVQAGMRGDAFEAALERRGCSMGHFPQSIAVSSVGGWVATRASGQFSTRYGNIEDMLIGFEAVLASGEVVRLKPAPRRSTGPDLCGLFLGSEGTLGVLTELTFRIHPRPEHRHLSSYVFDDMCAGLEAVRLVMRAGWTPAVLRLYDDIESARHFSAHASSGCMLLAVSEGPKSGVEAEAEAVATIAREAGGKPCGEAPVASWLERRNEVPTWDHLFDEGIVADTIEIAAPWDQVPRVYEDATAALREVPGLLLASAHSSHSYVQGTCLYITLAIHAGNLADGPALYERCWEATMRATLAAGGTISHHHGIGRVRRPWLQKELGSAYGLLRVLKSALDPNGIMNPGVLI